MSSAGPNGTSHFGGRPGAAPGKSLGSTTTPDGPANEEPGIAVIGSGITITGNVDSDVDLQIDGRVMGDVRCGTLLLSENALVTGNIFADRVRLSGQVDGGVEATDVAIEPGAHVRGEISYSRLRVANGGIFEGSMTHRPIHEDAREGERLKLVEREARPAPKAHHIE
jgi:cytoskeletal protein CcmA (bactofilin family)